MTRRSGRPFPLFSTLGALAFAVSLGACGLKGSLDPPPSAPPKAQVQGEPGATAAGPAEPAPPPPPPGKKTFFLDWLLN